ncbi:unnamed protein product, partial [Symbiodinium natans]
SHHGGGVGKGYKGDGKGKGKGKDFSSDQVPEDRRSELCDQLEAFLQGPDPHLEMPPTVTGLERKFLHEQAELRGLTTQSFGQGRERYICIFKQERSVEGPVAEEREGDAVEQASYTGVFLDTRSRGALLQFCASSVPGGVPHHWSQFCDHMTICVGALSNPKTEDYRSVADTVQKQIAKYREGQEFELKVVSVGKDDHVLAVGVIGCTSCNRNPHITVATAPGYPPNTSNNIKKWTMISADEQFTLTGVLRQHQQEGQKRRERARDDGKTASQQRPQRPEAKTSSWHGRSFKLRLHCEPGQSPTPEATSWFGLGERPETGQRNALMDGFSHEAAARFTFHQVGVTAGNELLNPSTLPPGVVMTAKVPVYTLEGALCFRPDAEWVREVDEGPGPEYFVDGADSEGSVFAFLPLEAGTHRPRPGGELLGQDAFYGIYYMERAGDKDTYGYWNQGDWPVYMIEGQLCRASDECNPPLQVHVEFDQYKFISLEFACKEDTILATARGMSGDLLLEVVLDRTETLRGLHKKVKQELYKQHPDTPAGICLTLTGAEGQLLSPPPPPSEPDQKLLDFL